MGLLRGGGARLGIGTVSGLAALAVVLAGCQSPGAVAGGGQGAGKGGSQGSGQGAGNGSGGQPAHSPVSLVVSPLDGATKVRPDQKVSVTASGGTLTTVTLTAEGGAALLGSLSDDHRTWTSDDPLRTGTAYTLNAAAAGADGKNATSSARFSTLAAAKTTTASVQPSSGTVVGVGMPVIVTFSRPVAARDRAAVEQRLKVTSTPQVEGAWNWQSGSQIEYRPATYWPTGTSVKVTSDLTGVETAPGIWGKKGKGVTNFTVGSSMISTVDIRNHTLTVRKNGTVIRTIPITTGKPGFDTREGIKVIISRETTHQMDAASTGISKSDPEYYNLLVHYAMRLTWTGEFLHAAPWSVGSQGHANVSHGCTGMSMANAKWLFDNSKIGDVVQYVNGHRPLEPGNGYTVWNQTFAQWASGD